MVDVVFAEAPGSTCTSSAVVAPATQFPTLTITVNVDCDASGTITNTASVEGGGDATSANGQDMSIVSTGPDTDSDGIPDVCDICEGFDDNLDADADGIPDGCDACPNDVFNDADGDEVCGDVDLCPGTANPESVPLVRLGINRWALCGADSIFDTTPPKGRGPRRSYSTEDTRGCSCEQIIEELDLGKGHSKYGCSIGAMDTWVEFASNEP